ncbi:MAG: hypothetical protein F4X02_07740 [Chloroflexi bacterium]|nr:hypothetical protein [Chloroflexota bacterium]
MTTIGAYLPSQIWRSWTPAEAEIELARYKGYGINAIFAEADHYRRDIIAIAQNHGLRFYGGMACFNNSDALAQNPNLHPVGRDGRRRPKMNWYVGITPTCQAYAQARLNTLTEMARSYQLDGVWLDFIRWPLHWERELRADTPTPLEASFDEHTLSRFVEYAAVDIPTGTTSQKADWILSERKAEWIDFKCAIITDFVARAKAIVDTHLPGKPLGLDIVPARPPQRERLLGQRLRDLSAYADCFSPMLYHHALGFSTEWMSERLDDMAAQSDRPLIPFVQVDAFVDEDGPFSARDWERALEAVLSHGSCKGLIAFRGDMLHSNGRGRSLGNLLRY